MIMIIKQINNTINSIIALRLSPAYHQGYQIFLKLTIWIKNQRP